MRNILIINYAFLENYYNHVWDKNEILNLDSKNDRKRIIRTPFGHSNIDGRAHGGISIYFWNHFMRCMTTIWNGILFPDKFLISLDITCQHKSYLSSSIN